MPPTDAELPPPPRIRASDKDRDAVLSVITEAVTNGRLDPEETSERQDAAIAAKHLDDLLPLIADLPEGDELERRILHQLGRRSGRAGGADGAGAIAPYDRGPAPLAPLAEPGSAGPMNAVAIMSGREIDVPAGTSLVTHYSLMSGDNLDLCEVMGPGVELVITSYSMWAGNNIYVPPGVKIRDETINIMAGNDIRPDARGDGSNGTLVLKGVSLMAGHEVWLAKGYRPKDQRSLR